jgi:cytochrome P450
MEGQLWKTWRHIFNPGFSAGHLSSLTPDLVKATSIFCDVFKTHVQKGDIFAMKPATDNLTMDIIGKIVL